MRKSKQALALLVLVAVNGFGIREVRGELVFEKDLESKSAVSKKNISASNSDQTDFITEDEEEKKSPVVDNRKESETSSSSQELDKKVAIDKKDQKEISTSEMLRRQRMREELKNEDRLSQKLEELRLQDEMKRVDQMTAGTEKNSKAKAPEEEKIKEEKIGSVALVEQSSEKISKPADISPSQSVAAVEEKKKIEEDKIENRISVTPRGGFSSIRDSKFEITSKYAAGLTIGVDLSDYFAIEAGYTYSAYSVSAGNAYYYDPYFMTLRQQSLNMNQHLIDLGLRVNVLGDRYRIKPFVTGGFGYYRTSINLDDTTLGYVRQYNPNLANDYVISGFDGSIGGGVEFKITKNISLTGLFKYYGILTSTQSNPISSAAFVNPGSSTSNSGDSRLQASESLSKDAFYSLQGGVTISF